MGYHVARDTTAWPVFSTSIALARLAGIGLVGGLFGRWRIRGRCLEEAYAIDRRCGSDANAHEHTNVMSHPHTAAWCVQNGVIPITPMISLSPPERLPSVREAFAWALMRVHTTRPHNTDQAPQIRTRAHGT